MSSGIVGLSIGAQQASLAASMHGKPESINTDQGS